MPYEALLNNIEYMVWSVEVSDFGLTYYNKAFSTHFLTDFSSPKNGTLALGDTPNMLMLERTAIDFIELYQLTLAKGPLQKHIMTPKLTKHLLLSLKPYYKEGHVAGITVFADDVTERFKYRDELILSNELLSKKYMVAIEAISKLSALRDPYTAQHQKRVQVLSCAIAEQLSLNKDQCHNIAIGAVIHDIGKVYVPSDLLNKPGKLTELEYKLLQTHVEHAYDILKDMDVPTEVIQMVYQHHERLDGSGYPMGLFDKDICLESRILAVADVVEAIMSHRPYRPALGREVAIQELLTQRGILYDADIVDICIELIMHQDFSFTNN